MQLLNNLVDGVSPLDPDQWNEIASEILNAAKAAGFSPSGADLQQLVAATVDLAASGDWYRDLGVGGANTYIVQRVSPRPGLSQLVAATDGAHVRFRPSVANTGAATIEVAGLAAKAIRRQTGAALSGGELVTTQDVRLRYNQATDQFFLAPSSIVASTGAVASFVSAPIPADLTSLSSGADLEFTWDYSARNESEDWFGGATIDTTDLVVPANIVRVTIEPSCRWQGTNIGGTTDNKRFKLSALLNSPSPGTPGGFGPQNLVPIDEISMPLNKPIFQRPSFQDLEVTPGDVITIEHRHDTGGNQDILSSLQTYVNIFGFTS